VDELEVAPGLVATREFALWIPEERTAAISDLHLGFEAALAEQGVSIPRFQRREIKQVLRFLQARTEPVVVRGNHDNYLATILGDLRMTLHDRYDVAGCTFVHGHEDVASLGTIVLGHEHPAVKLRDVLGATVSVPAFLVADRVIVLPAFSPLALGSNVASYPYLSPILNRVDVDAARVVGIVEGEGLLDFGRVRDLTEATASLLLR